MVDSIITTGHPPGGGDREQDKNDVDDSKGVSDVIAIHHEGYLADRDPDEAADDRQDLEDCAVAPAEFGNGKTAEEPDAPCHVSQFHADPYRQPGPYSATDESGDATGDGGPNKTRCVGELILAGSCLRGVKTRVSRRQRGPGCDGRRGGHWMLLEKCRERYPIGRPVVPHVRGGRQGSEPDHVMDILDGEGPELLAVVVNADLHRNIDEITAFRLQYPGNWRRK
ncbi:MAG: hypothetical protein QOF48_3019 [Verrucomicrobiota bacterium]